MSLKLTVAGKPIAQARPRFVRRGKFVSTYNPQETEAGRFALSVMAQLPEGFKRIEGPVEMNCIFDMPIPSSTSKKNREAMVRGGIMHTKKPDLDNLVKFCKDCLKNIVWVDDSQVVQLIATKRYSELGLTQIYINDLDNPDPG